MMSNHTHTSIYHCDVFHYTTNLLYVLLIRPAARPLYLLFSSKFCYVLKHAAQVCLVYMRVLTKTNSIIHTYIVCNYGFITHKMSTHMDTCHGQAGSSGLARLEI